MGGGPLLPEIEPDTRQGWVEKWLLLAAEDAARERREDEEPSPNGGNLAVEEVIRRLGAVERR